MNVSADDNDTIAAIATAPGRGAIGIIRISGPRAVPIAASVFHGARGVADQSDWSAALGWIEHLGERIDEALCLCMRGPRSYTREDVVELHCHGGPAALHRVLAAVMEAGARPAGPGEFTRRAFLSGRIDLAQAEAVADVIASETAAAARAAAAQLAGGLSRRLGALRENLADLLARIEAGIDFSDEEDVTAITPAELSRRLDDARATLDVLLADAGAGRLLREGARVVIAGRTNVGKSTLMNALLRCERVIVTAVPGSTRDVVEDAVEIMGLPVRLFDTAGIRDDADPVESIGVSMARAALDSCDLALMVVDGSSPLTAEDRAIAATLRGRMALVVNKCDLPPALRPDQVQELAAGAPAVVISALTGQGIADLEREIAAALGAAPSSQEAPLLTNSRHISALRGCREALLSARAAREQGLSDEFAASDLREALSGLGEITGETATEEILGLIFSRFCIGK